MGNYEEAVKRKASRGGGVIPEVRTSKADPFHIEVLVGSTVYRLNAESYSCRDHGELIRSACNNIKIFHERRYVDRPYKVPHWRPQL